MESDTKDLNYNNNKYYNLIEALYKDNVHFSFKISYCIHKQYKYPKKQHIRTRKLLKKKKHEPFINYMYFLTDFYKNLENRNHLYVEEFEDSIIDATRGYIRHLPYKDSIKEIVEGLFLFPPNENSNVYLFESINITQMAKYINISKENDQESIDIDVKSYFKPVWRGKLKGKQKIKLQTNDTKFHIYHIVLIDENNIEYVSDPFTLISYKQFIGRQYDSFIYKLYKKYKKNRKYSNILKYYLNIIYDLKNNVLKNELFFNIGFYAKKTKVEVKSEAVNVKTSYSPPISLQNTNLNLLLSSPPSPENKVLNLLPSYQSNSQSLPLPSSNQSNSQSLPLPSSNQSNSQSLPLPSSNNVILNSSEPLKASPLSSQRETPVLLNSIPPNQYPNLIQLNPCNNGNINLPQQCISHQVMNTSPPSPNKNINGYVESLPCPLNNPLRTPDNGTSVYCNTNNQIVLPENCKTIQLAQQGINHQIINPSATFTGRNIIGYLKLPCNNILNNSVITRVHGRNHYGNTNNQMMFSENVKVIYLSQNCINSPILNSLPISYPITNGSDHLYNSTILLNTFNHVL